MSKGEASSCDTLSFRVGMYVYMYVGMYIRIACTIQFYSRVCISIMLGQCLHNNEAKMRPEETTMGYLEAGSASDDCKLFGRLAAYTALTATLVYYAMTKELL